MIRPAWPYVEFECSPDCSVLGGTSELGHDSVRRYLYRYSERKLSGYLSSAIFFKIHSLRQTREGSKCLQKPYKYEMKIVCFQLKPVFIDYGEEYQCQFRKP